MIGRWTLKKCARLARKLKWVTFYGGAQRVIESFSSRTHIDNNESFLLQYEISEQYKSSYFPID